MPLGAQPTQRKGRREFGYLSAVGSKVRRQVGHVSREEGLHASVLGLRLPETTAEVGAGGIFQESRLRFPAHQQPYSSLLKTRIIRKENREKYLSFIVLTFGAKEKCRVAHDLTQPGNFM